LISPIIRINWRGAVLALLVFPIGGVLAFAPRSDAQASTRQPPALAAVVRNVDAYYDHLHALKCTFDETYRGAGAERTESGTLWLKKSGKMRWEYAAPQPKLFVTDGHTAYFYVSGDPEAQAANIKDMDDLRSPLRYLLGKTKLEKELLDLKMSQAGNGEVVLSGTPRSMADRITEVELRVRDNQQIAGIVIHERDGSSTEFRFSGIIADPLVNDSTFRFTPPPGVQVVRAGELAP
jgi:outer membrane lipoprotein carrier protein